MRPRFVIADDSAYSRDLIRSRLELLGCEVIGEVENALDAMKLCRELLPEAIAIDPSMPTVGGLPVSEAVRRIGRELPQIAIVIVMETACADALRGDEEAFAVVKAIVRKPISQGGFDLISRQLNQLFGAPTELDHYPNARPST
jgi:CheY-like chemotaxis protein